MNWKGEAIQFVLFLGLPLLGALATLAALRAPWLDGLSRRRWTWWAAALFLLSRVGVHVLAFHVFRWAGSGDLNRVWLPTAEAALAGEDPVRHLDNLYGPLFPWVLGLGLAWTGGAYPPGINLPFVLADAAALVVLLRLARRHMPETSARRLTLAVLLSPLVWFDNTVQSQEESLFALCLLLALDLLDRGRERWGCAAAAAGTALTKALFPFWAFPVLLAAGGGASRSVRRVLGAAALTLGLLGGAVVLGWNPLSQFGENINVFGSSSWLLFAEPKSASPEALRAGLAVAAAGMVLAGLCARRRRDGESVPDAAARGVTAVQGVYVLLSPFLLTAHLAQGLPFLAWQAVREGACRPRPGGAAWILAAGFALWQVPSLAVRAERWVLHPWMLAAFTLFWTWTAWRAATAVWPPVADGTDRQKGRNHRGDGAGGRTFGRQ